MYYGLDDRAIEVRSPTGAEDFSSSPCVQTGSGASSHLRLGLPSGLLPSHAIKYSYNLKFRITISILVITAARERLQCLK
jgi:hypothetical protein